VPLLNVNLFGWKDFPSSASSQNKNISLLFMEEPTRGKCSTIKLVGLLNWCGGFYVRRNRKEKKAKLSSTNKEATNTSATTQTKGNNTTHHQNNKGVGGLVSLTSFLSLFVPYFSIRLVITTLLFCCVVWGVTRYTYILAIDSFFFLVFEISFCTHIQGIKEVE